MFLRCNELDTLTDVLLLLAAWKIQIADTFRMLTGSGGGFSRMADEHVSRSGPALSAARPSWPTWPERVARTPALGCAVARQRSQRLYALGAASYFSRPVAGNDSAITPAQRRRCTRIATKRQRWPIPDWSTRTTRDSRRTPMGSGGTKGRSPQCARGRALWTALSANAEHLNPSSIGPASVLRVAEIFPPVLTVRKPLAMESYRGVGTAARQCGTAM